MFPCSLNTLDMLRKDKMLNSYTRCLCWFSVEIRNGAKFCLFLPLELALFRRTKIYFSALTSCSTWPKSMSPSVRLLVVNSGSTLKIFLPASLASHIHVLDITSFNLSNYSYSALQVFIKYCARQKSCPYCFMFSMTTGENVSIADWFLLPQLCDNQKY